MWSQRPRKREWWKWSRRMTVWSGAQVWGKWSTWNWTCDRKSKCLQKEKEALQFFQETVKDMGGRYKVHLPWRENKSQLSSSRTIAETRLNNLRRKFKTNAVLYERDDEVIADDLQQNTVEPAEKEQTDNPVHCWPHHAVIKEERSTTELRIVFDGSAHENDSKKSWNECSLTGPDLNPELLGVLTSFRQHPVAFRADLSTAFLQTQTDERDRDALCFLRITERPSLTTDVTKYTWRMTRVPFGATASPFLSAAAIRHHLEK